MWSPSYNTCGALKTGGWLQSVHRPRVDPSCGRADAWTRGRINRPFFFFFLDKSRKLSKILSVLQSASVKRFDVSRMRDFFGGIYHFQISLLQISLLQTPPAPPAPSVPPAPPSSSSPTGEAQTYILVFIPDCGCFRLEQQLLG